jgi:hypothetical protein
MRLELRDAPPVPCSAPRGSPLIPRLLGPAQAIGAEAADDLPPERAEQLHRIQQSYVLHFQFLESIRALMEKRL